MAEDKTTSSPVPAAVQAAMKQGIPQRKAIAMQGLDKPKNSSSK